MRESRYLTTRVRIDCVSMFKITPLSRILSNLCKYKFVSSKYSKSFRVFVLRFLRPCFLRFKCSDITHVNPVERYVRFCETVASSSFRYACMYGVLVKTYHTFLDPNKNDGR